MLDEDPDQPSPLAGTVACPSEGGAWGRGGVLWAVARASAGGSVIAGESDVRNIDPADRLARNLVPTGSGSGNATVLSSPIGPIHYARRKREVRQEIVHIVALEVERKRLLATIEH